MIIIQPCVVWAGYLVYCVFLFFFLFLIYVRLQISHPGFLPIGVKLHMAVRSHLRQVFSHLGGQPQGWSNLGRQQRAVWRDMLLDEALAYVSLASGVMIVCG